jgi:predicted GTPase
MKPAKSSSDSVGLEVVSDTPAPASEACATCSVYRAANLKKLGVALDSWDFVVALAGNPNTGKSTVFNALTGLRQHTGNWPGKTVTRAEGGYAYADRRYKLVDLPGTYSLLSTSLDEQIARDFILFGQPDVTVIVVDATRLERNLNLVLQILEITDRAVICLNLMDEAQRHGIHVDDRQLARDLRMPVVPAAARYGRGMPELLEVIGSVAAGAAKGRPHGGWRPSLPRSNPRWMTWCIGSCPRIPICPTRGGWRCVCSGAMIPSWRPCAAGNSAPCNRSRRRNRARSRHESIVNTPDAKPATPSAEAILQASRHWRQQIAGDLHEHVVEAIYAEAARIADRAVSFPIERRAPPSIGRWIAC